LLDFTSDPKLFLVFAQFFFGAFALGNVANETDEAAFTVQDHFAEADFDGNLSAVLAACKRFGGAPIDAAQAGLEVAGYAGVVPAGKPLGLEHAEVFAHQFLGRVTEQVPNGGIGEMDGPDGIHEDNGIR